MILDRFKLDGKVAIVTGSGRGIGKGIALAFAEAGADVVCAARTGSEIEAVAAEVRALGRNASAVPCDVRDEDQVEHMVNVVKGEFGRIDVLVNNAGAGFYTPVMQMSQRAFESVLRTNLTSAFLCSKAVAQVMLEQRAGSIINISTRDSIIPCPGMIAYGAAKAGVNSFTRTLAWELAPYVRVNCIMPGGVWTEGSTPVLEPVKDKIIAGTPTNRMGSPEDIALAAIYLASSASDWVTGRLFEIDGGIEFVHLDVEAIIGR
ncbi:SDR family NAD(P)-dependent oxidoreductase [Chloroflexota bacterium]